MPSGVGNAIPPRHRSPLRFGGLPAAEVHPYRKPDRTVLCSDQPAATPVSATGFTKLFAAACLCREFDLTHDEAQSLLRRWLTESPLPYAWTDRDLDQKIRDAYRKAERGKRLVLDLQLGCGQVADRLRTGCDCPNCPNTLTQGNSTGNKDNPNLSETHPEPIRNPWASFHFNPWHCHKVFGVKMGNRCTSALFPAVCGKRSCPECGPQWKKETWERFASHILAYRGPLFVEVCHACERDACMKAMRRNAKARAPLRYVAFRDDENYLTIISSAPASDDATEVSPRGCNPDLGAGD